MAGATRTVRTLDEYSYIVKGRKVTVPKGQVLYERQRPNDRWVYVSYRPEVGAESFCLPSRVIQPVEVDRDDVTESFTPSVLLIRAKTEPLQMTDPSCPTQFSDPDDEDEQVPSNSPTIPLTTASPDEQPTEDVCLPVDSAVAASTVDSQDCEATGKVAGEEEEEEKDLEAAEHPGADEATIPSDVDEQNARSSENPEMTTSLTSAVVPEQFRWRIEVQDDETVYIDTETNEMWMMALDPKGYIYYYEAGSRRTVWDLDGLHTTQPSSFEETTTTPPFGSVAGHADEESSCSENVSSDDVSALASGDDRIRTMRQAVAKLVESKDLKSSGVSGNDIRRTLSRKFSMKQNSLQPIDYRKAEVQLPLEHVVISEASDDGIVPNTTFKIEEPKQEGKETNAYLVQMEPTRYQACDIAFSYAKDFLKNKQQLASNFLKHVPQETATLRPPGKLDVRLLDRVKELLKKRSSQNILRNRGILKNEPVFASSLVQVCENENSEVPRFLVCSIRAMECRGLDLRWIYRTTGSVSAIQSARFDINQNKFNSNSDSVTLETITGVVKLFFRELEEPLFHSDIFPNLRELFSGDDRPLSETIEPLRNAINTMPKAHIATARVLFHHLLRVTQQSEDNGMDSHNLALVFAPTLIRPPKDSSMTIQNVLDVETACVKFCIDNAEEIFGTEMPPPVVS